MREREREREGRREKACAYMMNYLKIINLISLIITES